MKKANMDLKLNFCITCLVYTSLCTGDGNVTEEPIEQPLTRQCNIAKYPYYVVIKLGDGYCAGSILSSRHILTAGHCCTAKQYSFVYTGFKTLNNYDQKMSIKSYRRHRILTEGTPIILFDFCIMKLQKPLKFTQYTQVVKLPNINTVSKMFETRLGKEVMFIGYGQDYHRVSYADIQKDSFSCMYANLSEQSDCAEYVIGFHDESMVCALDVNSVPGDSGAPILLQDIQVAVVSKREDPVIGGRIDNQLQWILQVRDASVRQTEATWLIFILLCALLQS